MGVTFLFWLGSLKNEKFVTKTRNGSFKRYVFHPSYEKKVSVFVQSRKANTYLLVTNVHRIDRISISNCFSNSGCSPFFDDHRIEIRPLIRASGKTQDLLRVGSAEEAATEIRHFLLRLITFEIGFLTAPSDNSPLPSGDRNRSL